MTPPQGEIVIHLSQPSDKAVLQVDDQGPGIPPERAQKIFEPFFTTYATGTGLGLAIVRRAMEVQDGSVTAGSSPSGGARFQLDLPAAPSRH
ncbi:MAG: ATP-binding protein [Myxococcaceae bacterium]